jgi:hypothetical protein
METSGGYAQDVDASPSPDLLSIRVSTMSGAELGVLSVSSSMIGSELLERVKQLQPFQPDCILKLVFGECCLEKGKSMAEQSIKDTSDCKSLWRQVSEVERREVISKVESGMVVDGDDAEIWEGLQNLAFAGDFNQSLEQMNLPSGLQNLTFGYLFNQRLEKVRLPSGLQNLRKRKLDY